MGQTNRTSTVALVNDAIAEDEEMLQLLVTRPADAPAGLVIGEGDVTVTVRDTDSECVCVRGGEERGEV